MSEAGLQESLARRICARIEDLDASGLRRSLRPPSGIDLSSNDYLGLSQHPLLKQRMAEAVMREGVGSTGSRLLRGERECFSRVERKFAAFKGTERSLYFSSGYLANIAVLSTFPEEGDVIYSDERNHASLIDGMRLSRAQRVIFPHNDVGALGRLLRAHKGLGQQFVVVESLFSMDGDAAPLVAYIQLCREHGAALIVDEAHAVGVYGTRGSGIIEDTDIGEEVFLSINTAGKALGVGGAFVAGSESAIEYLVQRARPFVFSTAPAPPFAAAIEAALEMIAMEPERRERLFNRARFLRGLLEVPGTSQIIPVIIGENARAVAVARELQAEGFDVRAIRPPTVAPGTARLRIAVNEGLSETTLQRFADALRAALSR